MIFRHYGYAEDAASFANGLNPGGYATSARGRPMSGRRAQQKLALPHEQPPDCYFRIVADPTTIRILGPRHVRRSKIPLRLGGGIEYVFPEGTPPGSVSGPFAIPLGKRK